MSTVVTTYTVKGMTCEHCARAVHTELARLDGVHRIDIDLASGRVTVGASRRPADDAVRAAVDEAGYELGP